MSHKWVYFFGGGKTEGEAAMKKALVMALTGSLLVGLAGPAGQAQAGDREWAVAGKVLAGLVVLDALTAPRCPTPVVYQPAVVYPAPVVYAPPVVVRRPVVYYPAPVTWCSGVSFSVSTCRAPCWRPRRPVFRSGYRRGYRAGHRHCR